MNKIISIIFLKSVLAFSFSLSMNSQADLYWEKQKAIKEREKNLNIYTKKNNNPDDSSSSSSGSSSDEDYDDISELFLTDEDHVEQSSSLPTTPTGLSTHTQTPPANLVMQMNQPQTPMNNNDDPCPCECTDCEIVSLGGGCLGVAIASFLAGKHHAKNN